MVSRFLFTWVLVAALTAQGLTVGLADAQTQQRSSVASVRSARARVQASVRPLERIRNTPRAIAQVRRYRATAERMPRFRGRSSLSIEGREIHAVVFDLDGTLVDSRAALAHTFMGCAERFGHSITFERAMSVVDGSLRTMIESLYGRAPSTDEYDAYVEAWRDEAPRHISRLELLPGAIETLQRLDTLRRTGEIRVGLATGQITEYANRVLQHFGVSHYFDIVEGSGGVSGGDTPLIRAKPKPDLLQYTAHRLNVAVGRVIYVGDTRGDVEAARAAGMPQIGVTTGGMGGNGLRDARPTVLGDSLFEVMGRIGVR